MNQKQLEARFTEEDLAKALDAVVKAVRICDNHFGHRLRQEENAPAVMSDLIERLRPYALQRNEATLCFHGLQEVYRQRTGREYKSPVAEE